MSDNSILYFWNKYMYYQLNEMSVRQSGGNIICTEIAIRNITDNERQTKKKIVYEHLLKTVFMDSPNIAKLKKHHIKAAYQIIDSIYFDRQISSFAKKNKITLTFKVSAQLTKTAGKCVKYSDKKYEIVISSVILESLFKNNEVAHKINGINCKNSLECFISLMEHELTHLIIMIFCPNDGLGMGGHTATFKNITFNLFGHTEYKHMLLHGDSNNLDGKLENIKANIKIGSIVRTTNGIEGTVLKLNPKTVKIKTNDFKYYAFYYFAINEIIGHDDTINIDTRAHTDANIASIKDKLTVGQIITVKFKGTIKSAKIISINSKKLKAEIDDKLWYIPYSFVVQ